MTIMFNRRFVEPILSGTKIHTIRANYDFWRRHDGRECSFRVWQGKPYRSPQEEFYRAKIGVQSIIAVKKSGCLEFWPADFARCLDKTLAKNDGLSVEELYEWFRGYPPAGLLAVLHFTNFRY